MQNSHSALLSAPFKVHALQFTGQAKHSVPLVFNTKFDKHSLQLLKSEQFLHPTEHSIKIF